MSACVAQIAAQSQDYEPLRNLDIGISMVKSEIYITKKTMSFAQTELNGIDAYSSPAEHHIWSTRISGYRDQISCLERLLCALTFGNPQESRSPNAN
jgi:hypothetical protein